MRRRGRRLRQAAASLFPAMSLSGGDAKSAIDAAYDAALRAGQQWRWAARAAAQAAEEAEGASPAARTPALCSASGLSQENCDSDEVFVAEKACAGDCDLEACCLPRARCVDAQKAGPWGGGSTRP